MSLLKNQGCIQTDNTQDNFPIILTIPISYDNLINSSYSIEKKIEHILSENPTNLFPSNNIFNTDTFDKINDLPKNSYVLPVQEEHIVEHYKNIDNYGIEYSTTIYNNYILPTMLDTNKIKSTKTDICCWWCCYQFDTQPICAPVKYIPSKDIFKVIGCFCSFNCAKAHMLSIKATDISLISFLQKKINGKYTKFEKAPPKEILKKFGGSVSINEYRDSFTNVISFNKIDYPMSYIPSQLEKRKTNIIDKKLADENIDFYNKNKTLVGSNSSNLYNSKIKKSIIRQSLTKNNKKNTNSNSLHKMFNKT